MSEPERERPKRDRKRKPPLYKCSGCDLILQVPRPERIGHFCLRCKLVGRFSVLVPYARRIIDKTMDLSGTEAFDSDGI